MRLLFHFLARAALGMIACLAAGCATVDPKPDYERTQKLLEETVGESTCYRPGDDALIATKVDELLREGVSVDEAVRIALLNNPLLQAAFFRVGMSRADVVQSGLFSNPSLALSAQFPEGGGRSNFQASIAQNIVDLWQIPIRRRIAQAKLNQEILSLAQQAAQLCADTKVAYFAALGTARIVEIAEANLGVAQGLFDTTQARKKAGAVGELDVNLAQGTALNTELEVQTARLDAANAKRRLATILGLTNEADSLELTDSFPEPPELDLADKAIVELALTSRLDLQAAQRAVDAGDQRVKEEYARIFPDVSIGANLERGERRAQPGRDIAADTARASIAAGGLTAPEIQSRAQRDQERRQEIDTIFGPALNMTLPIFDQNQAQIAKAKFAYQTAMKERDALEKSIVQDARQAVDQAATASRISLLYETKVLPQAQKNLDLSSASYKAGKTSIITVMDAQRFLLATGRLAVSARQSAASAIADLERVIGRPIAIITTRNSAASPPTMSETGAEANPSHEWRIEDE